MTLGKLDKQAALFLKNGDLQELERFLSVLKVKTKKLVILENMISIFKEEVKNNVPFTVFDYSLDLDTVVKHYMITKLLLRRFDFDLPVEYQEEFYYYCVETNVSECFITYLLERNIFYPEEVRAKVKELFRQKAVNVSDE